MKTRRLGVGLASLALVVSAAACTGEGADATGAEGGGSDPVKVQIAPEDGAKKVRPDLPVTVTADNGEVKTVKITQSGGAADEKESPEGEGGGKKATAELNDVKGSLNKDKTEWVSTQTLVPGADIKVTATAENGDGEETEVVSEFSAEAATDGKKLEVQSNFPQSGETVGVGMPVIVNFDLPVTNKLQVENAIEVVSEEPAEGAWNWFGDKMAVFRPSEYWKPEQKVHVNMRLAGVQAADGVYGVKNQRLDFEVGREQITTIDDKSHQMVVERDGKEIKDFPISNGDASTLKYTTTSGVHLTMEKYAHLVMDSATVGVPKGHPDYYKLDVNWAVRFSNSGEFTHAAPWNGSLGQANMSHGCTNMSTADAKWFHDESLMGDPFIVEGTKRELEVDNGWGYWQRSWDEWLEHSKTGKADKTDDEGTPGASTSKPENGEKENAESGEKDQKDDKESAGAGN
ncbi:L,D-transpeptidase [Murinocardiopsis flavida]|nr:Ig-like domain-containing protein [Murinocardiopsis flavida]